MLLKSLGMTLLMAGVLHTGIGISELSAHSHEVSLVGFVSLLVGIGLYLSGTIEQRLTDHGRNRPPD